MDKPVRLLPKHKREADRLVQMIAICTLCPQEGLAQAERDVRRKLHRSALQNQKPEVALLREMWADLKEGKAHQTTNRMVASGLLRTKTFDDFERKKSVLRTFQRRARHWEQTKHDWEHRVGDFAPGWSPIKEVKHEAEA